MNGFINRQSYLATDDNMLRFHSLSTPSQSIGCRLGAVSLGAFGADSPTWSGFETGYCPHICIVSIAHKVLGASSSVSTSVR